MAESGDGERETREVGRPEEGSSDVVSEPDDSAGGTPSLERLRGRAEFFAGPLPPPAIFQEYESVLPGSADRILAMAEKQSAHRQDLETRALETNAYTARWGQRFAFVLGLLGIVGAVVLVVMGRTWPGLIMFFTDFFGLAGLFLWTEHRGRKELRRKAEATATHGESDTEQRELPFSEGSSGSQSE